MPWLHNHWLSLSVGRAGRLLRKALATAKLPRETQSQVFFNYDSWVGQNHHVISHPVGWKSIATHRTNRTDNPRRTNSIEFANTYKLDYAPRQKLHTIFFEFKHHPQNVFFHRVYRRHRRHHRQARPTNRQSSPRISSSQHPRLLSRPIQVIT